MPTVADHHRISGSPSLMAPRQELWLSGAMVCALMRKHGVTIDGLATRFQLTRKRVRQVRAEGVAGFLAHEWTFMITGQWPK